MLEILQFFSSVNAKIGHLLFATLWAGTTRILYQENMHTLRLKYSSQSIFIANKFALVLFLKKCPILVKISKIVIKILAAYKTIYLRRFGKRFV